jgi:hypothetical protein
VPRHCGFAALIKRKPPIGLPNELAEKIAGGDQRATGQDIRRQHGEEIADSRAGIHVVLRMHFLLSFAQVDPVLSDTII